MKKYNITVNGTKYEVEVDEIGGAPVPAPATAPAPAAAPAAAPAPAPAAAHATAPSADALVIESPMPGTILDVRKKAGDAVAAEECVLILEAMKMENEIVAPRAGIIDSVAVSKGASVNAGDVIFSIK